MSDAEEDRQGLAQLDEQRGRLADRVQPPWWYLAGFALIMAVVCAMPFATRYLDWAAGWPAMLALLVFYALQWALGTTTGVSIGTRTLRYPSGRVAGIAMMVVVVAAIVAETILLGHGLDGEALVAGIFAVAAAVVCQQAHLRGIRRDLRAGNAAPGHP